MHIREKIKEIEDAIDVMLQSRDTGDSFHNLKKTVVEKIHETEDAADALLGSQKLDISDDIKGKLKEVEDATGSLLNLEDDEVSKEVGGRIRELVNEIKDAADTMIIDDRLKK